MEIQKHQQLGLVASVHFRYNYVASFGVALEAFIDTPITNIEDSLENKITLFAVEYRWTAKYLHQFHFISVDIPLNETHVTSSIGLLCTDARMGNSRLTPDHTAQ